AAVVDSSADSILSIDLKGNVTSWNHGAERLFGYSGKEMIGKSIRSILPPGLESEHVEILERVGRDESLSQLETMRLRKDGRQVPVSLTVSPIKNAHGEVVGASKVARDLTETVRALEEREQLLAREKAARDEAVAANEAKDLFLAMLSH